MKHPIVNLVLAMLWQLIFAAGIAYLFYVDTGVGRAIWLGTGMLYYGIRTIRPEPTEKE